MAWNSRRNITVDDEILNPMEISPERRAMMEKRKSFIENPVFGEETRYRCEQTVAIKQNAIIKSHAETKREFLVKKTKNTLANVFLYNVEMVDNAIDFYPSSMKPTMDLMCMIDSIKNNVLIQPYPNTGKIQSILNKEKLIENWNGLKNELQSKFDFVRDPKTKNQFAEFVAILDNQFKNENILIADLETKLFFDLFFDKYLVGKENFIDPFVLHCKSQLFEDIIVDMKMQQIITAESQDLVTVTKIGKVDKNSSLLNKIEGKYNERYKPTIGYKFSSYDYTYRIKEKVNTKDALIDEIVVTILEEVKNNVQVLVNYTIKRIEL